MVEQGLNVQEWCERTIKPRTELDQIFCRLLRDVTNVSFPFLISFPGERRRENFEFPLFEVLLQIFEFQYFELFPQIFVFAYFEVFSQIFEFHQSEVFSAIFTLYPFISFQIPFCCVTPGPVYLAKKKMLVQWKSGEVHRFSRKDEQLLPEEFPIVIAFNGIHHFTSTKLVSPEGVQYLSLIHI